MKVKQPSAASQKSFEQASVRLHRLGWRARTWSHPGSNQRRTAFRDFDMASGTWKYRKADGMPTTRKVLLAMVTEY